MFRLGAVVGGWFIGKPRGNRSFWVGPIPIVAHSQMEPFPLSSACLRGHDPHDGLVGNGVLRRGDLPEMGTTGKSTWGDSNK